MKKDYIVLQKLDSGNDAVIATIFKSHVGAIYPFEDGVCILLDGCKVYADDSYPDVVKQMFD